MSFIVIVDRKVIKLLNSTVTLFKTDFNSITIIFVTSRTFIVFSTEETMIDIYIFSISISNKIRFL